MQLDQFLLPALALRFLRFHGRQLLIRLFHRQPGLFTLLGNLSQLPGPGFQQLLIFPGLPGNVHEPGRLLCPFQLPAEFRIPGSSCFTCPDRFQCPGQLTEFHIRLQAILFGLSGPAALLFSLPDRCLYQQQPLLLLLNLICQIRLILCTGILIIERLLFLDPLIVAFQFSRPVPELVFDLLIDIRIEQNPHDAFALRRIRHEKATELPLRQQDNLPELSALEPQQGMNLLADFRIAAPGLRHRSVFDMLQGDLGKLLGRTTAPLRLAQVLRVAPDMPLLGTQGKDEIHIGRHIQLSFPIPQHARTPGLISRLAIERVAYRIKNAGLARTGRTVDQKEMVILQLREIQFQLALVWSKGT